METVLRLLVYAIEIYSWALIIYILLSWFPGAKEQLWENFLRVFVNLYLEPYADLLQSVGMT